jgi:hypothetical protein
LPLEDHPTQPERKVKWARSIFSKASALPVIP